MTGLRHSSHLMGSTRLKSVSLLCFPNLPELSYLGSCSGVISVESALFLVGRWKKRSKGHCSKV